MAYVKNAVGLTDKQAQFVEQLVSKAMNPTAAARAAGFETPAQAAYRLLRLPHVASAVRDARARLIDGDLANVALDTLRVVMTDSDAPAAARVSAARTVLEMSGELKKDGSDASVEKRLHEMSADELAAVIDRWESQRSAMAKDITPGAELAELPAPGA